MNYSQLDIELCPCKSCTAPKRHVGCHDDCKSYSSWKRAYEAEKAKLDNEKWISQLGVIKKKKRGH